MIEITQIDNPNPAELWEILDRHGLISYALKNNPNQMLHICATGSFFVWHEDGNPLALHFELRSADPEVIDMFLVPEDRWLGKRKVEISGLQTMLRERWFDGHRRVQASVPASRVNIHRVFKSLGFTEETRRDVGLRNGIRLGKKPEGIVLYGLLESDPLRFFESSDVPA